MMALHWNQIDNKLVAETEFGKYEISVSTTRRTNPVDVCLVAFKEGVEFKGQHLTIGTATDAANTDYAYRQKMWEIL
jgi:hypothetical protein